MFIPQGIQVFKVFQDGGSTHIGGHDNDGIPEVSYPAFVVRQPAILQDLQEDVEGIGMGLLDLIQQDNGIGDDAYRFRQLTAFIIPDAQPGGARSGG